MKDETYSLRLSSGLFGSSVEIGVLILAWILLFTTAAEAYLRAMTIMPSEKEYYHTHSILMESNALLYSGSYELHIVDTVVFLLEFCLNITVIIAMNQGNGNLLSICKSILLFLLLVRVILFITYSVTSFIDELISLGLFYIGMTLIYLTYYLYYFLMIISCFNQYMTYMYPVSPPERASVYNQPQIPPKLTSILKDPSRPCPPKKNRTVLSVVSSFCKIPNPRRPEVHY